MEMETISSAHFPPGFRFHPSDEELIVHYLMKKLSSRPLPAAVVAEVELYNYNPWDLQKKASFGEDEWYFFTPRDRKYPNGARPNRTAASGYWKATGTDKPILSASGSRSIGVKKALVFYTGRPPKGVKTDWIMIEYRLPDTMTRPLRSKGSMRLDDWVLCRIRRKGNMSKKIWAVEDRPSTSVDFMLKIEELPSAYTEANTDYLLKDCHILASMLACQDIPPIMSNATFPQRNSNSDLIFDAHTSGKGNTFTTSSLFEGFLNPTKEKLNEGNSFDSNEGNSFDSLISDGYGNEVLFPRNMMTTSTMNFYNQNQAQGNIFNPNQPDAIMNLLLSREDF